MVSAIQSGASSAYAGATGGLASKRGSSATLSAEQRARVTELATIDRTVRAHEMAHLAAAGAYSRSGATYSYAAGPDGQLYAIGGEVSLDVSPNPSDPRKTIEKAQVIKAAAEAPADPSGQDRAVAAAAAQMEAQAQQQLTMEQQSAVAAAYGENDTPVTGSLLSLLA